MRLKTTGLVYLEWAIGLPAGAPRDPVNENITHIEWLGVIGFLVPGRILCIRIHAE